MLENIKGIGPKTIKYLNDLNIYNINDLLTYYPYRYNVYNPSIIENAKENEEIVINGTIASFPKLSYIKKNLNILSFNLNTSNKLIKVTIFNRSFIKQEIVIGKTITVIGKYNPKTNTLTASDIKLIPILKPKLEPVYHLNEHLKKSNFNKILNEVLKENYYLINYIPNYLQEKYNFIDKQSAIKEIHNPTNIEQMKKSKLMLIYEELFEFTLKMNYLKMNKTASDEYYIKTFDNALIEEFISKLPYNLTKDQKSAIEDIKNDFTSPKRMNRIILGDVGSGKTIVAFISLYMNYLSGFQGVLMAPTEILAKQHYENMQKLFDNLNIRLLTSSTTKLERKEIIESIKTNKIDILISTHSVLNDDIVFNKLGLVITDEQHRFGVNQRKNLQSKGKYVDVLYMSATPIPRTFALSLFGDMDITEIKTKPQDRKPVITKILKTSEIKDMLNIMLEEIKKNHQVYVVSPLIEDSEETNLMTVKELQEKINAAFNNKIPIGILHGKMKNTEKEKIMNDFKENKIKILISTTIIEIGVDVSNATLMVIFNAERFGLATLHQLRGRIGRNNLESKCLLISDYEIERLKVLEESNDGFYISEKDFELRGSGDLFGVKQSGDMNFKIANLKRDIKIFKKCNEDSLEFLKEHLQEIEKYPNQKEIISGLSFHN